MEHIEFLKEVAQELGQQNILNIMYIIFCIKFYRYLLFPEVIYQSVPEEAARSWKQTGHWHHSAL